MTAIRETEVFLNGPTCLILQVVKRLLYQALHTDVYGLERLSNLHAGSKQGGNTKQ